MRLQIGIAALALFALVACDDNGPGAGKRITAGVGTSFQERYAAARNDLEEGNFRAAIRKYRRLGADYSDSELAMRLNLELAHALLRGGAYDEAAQVAQGVVRGAQGPSRGMALAVLGTARHELARAGAGRGQLTAAEAALNEMLSAYPGLDQGGAMARRLRILQAEAGR